MDQAVLVFKILLIFSGFIISFLLWVSKEIDTRERLEAQVLMALSIFCMYLMCSTNHLLVLFLSYQMISFCHLALGCFYRNALLSSEAAMKFFTQVALSSVLFACGIALLYSIGQSFNIADIQTKLALMVNSPNQFSVTFYLWLCFGLVFISILAMMVVFPFHFTMVDVMQGVPLPVSALLLVPSIITSIVVAWKLCWQLFSLRTIMIWQYLPNLPWPHFIAILGSATMVVGSLSALTQKDLKKGFAFYCMSQIGFILTGFTIFNQLGMAATLFSLFSYSFSALGIFSILHWITDYREKWDIDLFQGLIEKEPYKAVILCIFLLSLAGLPPLSGFMSRFYLLSSLIQEKFYGLAFIGIVSWVLGLAYCLMIIRKIFHISKPSDYKKITLGKIPDLMMGFVVILLLIPTVGLGIYGGFFLEYLMQ